MRLTKIVLTNFRAFEQLALELEPRATLLIGRNGAGKSSVLEGIAVALGAWVSAFAAIKEDHPIASTDARLVTTHRANLPQTEARFPVMVAADCEMSDGRVLGLRRRLMSAGAKTITDADVLISRAHALESRLASEHTEDLPLVAYYGTGRLWAPRKRRAGTAPAPTSRLAGYRGALDAASDPKGFETWMRWRESDRIQRLARAHEAGVDLSGVRSPELEAVSAAACACLEGAQRMYYDANLQELRVQLVGGESLPFWALSDGQRNLLALAADLAWRATQLNPHQVNAPSVTRGVVLIDEIDLHLHAAWQRRALPDLLAAFPQLQFVVTTHSPQVLSTAPRDSVRLIDEQHRVHVVRHHRGRDTNAILEDVLDVAERPDQQKRDLEQLARLIEDGEHELARALLDRLAEDLGPHDARMVAARWELDHAGAPHAED